MTLIAFQIPAIAFPIIFAAGYFLYKKFSNGSGSSLADRMNVMKFNKTSTLTTPQKWAIACTSNVSITNGEFLDSLETSSSSSISEHSKSILSDWWNINNKSELIERLEKLKAEGVREIYKDAWKANVDALDNGNTQAQAIYVAKYKDSDYDTLNFFYNASKRKDYTDNKAHNPFKRFNVNNPNFLAWDYCRIISLCRWGYDAKYLTQQEAWSYITPAAKDIQKTYSSWEDMNDSYKVAKLIWNANQFEEQYADDSNLYSHEKSPFKNIPWSTNLN